MTTPALGGLRPAGRAGGAVAARDSWTPGEVLYLRMVYPSAPTPAIARVFGRSASSVYQKALGMGLRKSAAYMERRRAEDGRRFAEAGAASRFRRGLVPWNGGRKGWQAGGRSAETQFKPGERRGAAERNWVPLGTERVDPDGYLIRKVAETGRKRADWKMVHVIAWEDHNGTLPGGKVIVFRNGDRRDFRPENLEAVDRADLMRRNSVHRYPAELRHAMRLVKKLNRTIQERAE